MKRRVFDLGDKNCRHAERRSVGTIASICRLETCQRTGELMIRYFVRLYHPLLRPSYISETRRPGHPYSAAHRRAQVVRIAAQKSESSRGKYAGAYGSLSRSLLRQPWY